MCALINPALPDLGGQRGTEEGDVRSAILAILNEFNGNIDGANIKNNAVSADKLTTALANSLGVNNLLNVGKGKTPIPALENTNSVAYTLLGTPDRVSGLVLPSESIVVVRYTALWKVNGGVGSAAIFVGANQLVNPTTAGGAQTISEVTTNSGFFSTIWSTGVGITSNAGAVAGDNSSMVATGQTIVASSSTTAVGVTEIHGLPAGTYDVSVRYKNSLGGANQTQVKERHLEVGVLAF